MWKHEDGKNNPTGLKTTLQEVWHIFQAIFKVKQDV